MERHTPEDLYQQGMALWDKARETLFSSQVNLSAQRKQMLADSKAAVACWTAAAEQGHTLALYQLGEYFSDNGFGQCNRRKAAEWYRRAAEQGCAPAQYAYAFSGAPELDRRAWRALLERSAEGGH